MLVCKKVKNFNFDIRYFFAFPGNFQDCYALQVNNYLENVFGLLWYALQDKCKRQSWKEKAHCFQKQWIGLS